MGIGFQPQPQKEKKGLCTRNCPYQLNVTRQLPRDVRVQPGSGSLWMPQVLSVTVATRPSLSHSLQVGREEEPMFRLNPISSKQASVSRHKDQRAVQCGAAVYCGRLSHVSVT